MDLIPIARDIVLDHIPELVLVIDAHDRILDANLKLEKWLGKSKEEIIGRDPLEVFGAWPKFLNRILFATEETKQEIEISGKPPTTLELIVMPIFDEQTEALSGRVIVAHDITERKLLENHLSQLMQKLKEQAIRDPLTGVFNRRFFAEALDKEIAQATREQDTLSIVMLDMDHFKKINDTHGHPCGDEALQSLANFLLENSREGDIICRYGGEEFVILMPRASEADAYEKAEGWRREFGRKRFGSEARAFRVSFSAGVANFPKHGANGTALLRAADSALYQSKSHGRNQITLYKQMEQKNAN
ncbi:MAG: GGDEF domain-containing protein [Anaerolineales bacterium]|nr:GGDEF domain-containing protein [Anaerolineales bacterium]